VRAWPKHPLIHAIKRVFPDFLFIAETGRELELSFQQQG